MQYKELLKNLEDLKQVVDAIEEIRESEGTIENEKNNMNRFEIAQDKSKIQNSPALYGYNGISTFSSLSDGDF